MPEDYKHLVIEREPLTNDRRTRQFSIPRTPRESLKLHGQMLTATLNHSIQVAKSQVTSDTGRLVLKFRYTGAFDLTNLSKHGVEFVSQEDRNVCIVFASEKGLALFTDHLTRLGINDEELTYKNILEALDGIDNWTEEDRKSWALKHIGLPDTESFNLDIELWPINVSQHPERAKLRHSFETWLTSQSIKIHDKLNLDSLVLYRVLVTKDQAKLLLNHQDVRTVDLPPKTGIEYSTLNLDLDNVPAVLGAPHEDSPRVCILDSGINTNHPLLKACIGDAQSFVENQGAEDDCGHGTAVAGIAAFGDIEERIESGYWQSPIWVLSGKILFTDPSTNEPCFDIKTIERTLEEAVEYFVTERGCRIFNLSIGNLNSPYDRRHVKGIAYTLDQLSRRYDVLFIVSAGNFTGSDNPPVPLRSWREEYPDYLMDSQSSIIDPAPALNVITVGSLARHTATADALKYPNEISDLTPASEDQPSPFTRHGPSVKGALKPDLVATGGNLASKVRHGKEWAAAMRGLGVLTLNHNFIGKTLLSEASGTSFAAPYITHLAGRLLGDYPHASSNLLRALLINHASTPSNCTNTFPQEWREQYRKNNNWRELCAEVCGYGKVDDDTLYRSTDSEVVVLCEDEIPNNSHLFYELPLPDDFLRSKRATRTVTVTLAYTPPVRTTRIDYVGSKIFFRLVKGSSLAEVQKHFNHDTQDDTETLNDSVGDHRRSVSTQIRDKGTVQSSTWTFKQLRPKDKWFVVVTRQDRDWGTSVCAHEERFALVVRVSDHENEEADLYNQIETRIQQQTEIRQQNRERARSGR